jgi:hypothetical protein
VGGEGRGLLAGGGKEDARIRDLIFSLLISYATAIECLPPLPLRPLEVENYRLPMPKEGRRGG